MIKDLIRFINSRREPLYHETIQGDFPIVLCVGREESAARKLLDNIASSLPSLWPELYSTLESGFEGYGHSDEFPPQSFFVSISRTVSGCYMADQSSFYLRFEFPREKFSSTLGFYDFFLDDQFRTVHHQPVF
jgi:hypothetical protein